MLKLVSCFIQMIAGFVLIFFKAALAFASFPFIFLWQLIKGSGEHKPKRAYYKDIWGKWHWR